MNRMSGDTPASSGTRVVCLADEDRVRRAVIDADTFSDAIVFAIRV